MTTSPQDTRANNNASNAPYRLNQDIRVPRVRLIGQDGEMVGVVSRLEALNMASEAGLDLVEISPQADPPVCKIIDYGKFRYEIQKKKNEAKKKQKTVELKEIKLRPGIDVHDYDIKVRAIKRFIEEGNKVKITLRFRGREMAHQDLGAQVLERLKVEIDEIAKVEQQPKFEGKQMIMLLVPR